jgi:hypothetical protein
LIRAGGLELRMAVASVPLAQHGFFIFLENEIVTGGLEGLDFGGEGVHR